MGRFLYALGIRNVGEETTIDLAEHFGSLEKIKKAPLEKLSKIPDIGPVVAKSIYEYFRDKDNLKFIDKLLKVGVKIQEPKKLPAKKAKLRGQTFVFTGSLDTLTRDDAKDLVRNLGADVSETVSKNTSYVVVGHEPGSKYDDAKKLDIKMLSEKEIKVDYDK